MQNINPLPWGAQDRFQAHFIIKGIADRNSTGFLAESKLQTQGHFGSKKITHVEWIGEKISNILNNDVELAEMIKKLSYNDAHIWIDQTKNDVRIYGKWKNNYEFGISKELFAVYDRIASHIKQSRI